MKKTKFQLHSYRQKLLEGFNEAVRGKIYVAIRELKARMGRNLTHNEYEKLIHNIKYEK